MDDNHTHKMLESLADLFLTGTNGAAARVDPEQLGVGRHGEGAGDAFDGQLDGPAPIRLSPKVGASSRPQRVPPSGRAPLRLRMTENNEHDDTATPQPAGARVEAVFLGSLPGFAAPWLTQYAQWRAADVGTVGVLHISGEQVDVELVGREGDSLPRVELGDAGLAQVVRAFGAVKLWLICPAQPIDATTMRRLDRVERWTILSGSNEPAVLAASQLIGSLLEADAVDSPSATDRSIALMVMGSDGLAADEAVEQVNVALEGYIEQSVQLLGAMKKMEPVSVRIVGSYEVADDAWPDVLGAMIVPHEQRTAKRPAMPLRKAAQRSEPVRPAARVADAAEAPHIHAGLGAPSDDADTDAEPDLSTFLSGSLALQARCPRHPQTQIVLDQDGRLHLLRRHTGEASELHAAVIDLIEARSWVYEHLDLLKLTQRQCSFDTAAEPVLHLFTDHAKLATALISRLGRFARLHLFQRVQAGAESTWFCADLN